MTERTEIPRAPKYDETITLAALPGTKEALAEVAKSLGFPTWSAFARGVLEREIRDALPETYRSIKGAA